MGSNLLHGKYISGEKNKNNKIFMRDGSTAAIYYQIGDKIKVIIDVWHYPSENNNFNSKHMEGVISNIWEKCEVDPHCCCAELAFEAPFEVTFLSNHYYGDENLVWKAYFSADEIMQSIHGFLNDMKLNNRLVLTGNIKLQPSSFKYSSAIIGRSELTSMLMVESDDTNSSVGTTKEPETPVISDNINDKKAYLAVDSIRVVFVAATTARPPV
eukprot:gene8833-11923_t